MARQFPFPDLVGNGENPNAHCVSQTANGTSHDGIGGFEPDAYVKKSADGPRWGALGPLMLAAMAPSLKPMRRK